MDRTHTEDIGAAVVFHIAAVRKEAETPRVVREVDVERPRPVVAVGAIVAECGGQEERLAVLL